MQDYYTFLYQIHRDGLIFFARMGNEIVHIDPWMTNSDNCFDAGQRNSVMATFPESNFGYCLVTAVKSELNRRNVVVTDHDLRFIESFRLVEYEQS